MIPSQHGKREETHRPEHSNLMWNTHGLQNFWNQVPKYYVPTTLLSGLYPRVHYAGPLLYISSMLFFNYGWGQNLGPGAVSGMF